MSHRHSAGVFVLGIILLLGVSVRASHTDFEVKPDVFNVEGECVALGVSVGDRFVLAAERDNNRLIIIDTWNWHLATPLDSNSISGSPVAMAVSPEGNYVYISRTDGIVSRLDVSGLAGLGFNKRLNSMDPPITEEEITITDGNTLGDIEVIPQQGNPDVDCVFVVDETNGELRWFLVDGAGIIIARDLTPPIQSASEIELAAGNNTVFARYKINIDNRLYVAQCNQIGPLQENHYDIFGADDDDVLSGLAVDPWEFRLVIGDVNKTVHLFDVSDFWSISSNPSNSMMINDAPSELLFSDFSKETNPIVWVSEGDILSGAPVDDGPVEFTGEYDPVVIFSSTVTALAQSSTVDGYIYASSQDINSVFVVTANPWVSNLITDPSGTISTSLFTLEFLYDYGASYTVSRVEYFKDTGTDVAGGTLPGGETAVSVQISTYDLNEGTNILAVEVKDFAGRMGRNAVAVQVDMPPPPLDFDLDFGDEKLMVNFRAHDLPDLDYYEIYYGTNGDVPETDYDKLDDTGQMGDPGSPFKIDNPEPKKKYEKVIKGLKNGDTYFVQIISADDAGHISVSDRKSAVVQPVLTLTDLADEDGGFACFEMIGHSRTKGSGISLSVIIALFVPLFFAGLFRLLRRFKSA